MSHEKFITDFLNIKPEYLQEIITVKQPDGSLHVKVRLKPQGTTCPYCHKPAKVHGFYSRKLTHSVFNDRKCIIFYDQRRYICKDCQCTFSEKNPFINNSQQLTYITKVNILKDLKYPESTYSSVAQRFNVSVNRVIRIFDEGVDIPRKPLPEVLSIDEHYFPSSDYGSAYCCLLMDFVTGEMIDVLPDRRKHYLINYFANIKKMSLDYSSNKSELDNVKYVSIDMYENYRDVARLYFPKAKVCADSFHVLKHLTGDFNKVRLRCRRTTENLTFKYWLTKLEYIFRHNASIDNEPRYNKSLGRYMNLRDIREILFREFPELRAAYELKEYYVNMNETCMLNEAPKVIDHAISLFEACNIEEYDEFYGLLVNWREEIINSFTRINGKRINNSHIESKNRIVEKLIDNANGFKNFARTRNRILYCLNKGDTFKL